MENKPLSNPIEEEKIRVEIEKIQAETRSINKSQGWWKSWTPLVLAAMTLLGGYTQYTKASVNDREKAVEAREEVLYYSKKLSFLLEQIRAEEIKLTDVKSKLLENTAKLAALAKSAGADSKKIEKITESINTELNPTIISIQDRKMYENLKRAIEEGYR
jgi:hypothetical protein